MACKHGTGRDLLITYIEDFYISENGNRVRHSDLTFEPEWSYCTGFKRLLKCGKGNYVFFQTTPKTERKNRYITAFFVIKDVDEGDLVPKYNLRGGARHAADIRDHYVIVGDENRSRKLNGSGLRFDRKLAEKLTFDPPRKIRFGIIVKTGHPLSEQQCIASATRNIRVLSDMDVEILLSEIRRLGLA
jgi:hypothetical protein